MISIGTALIPIAYFSKQQFVSELSLLAVPVVPVCSDFRAHLRSANEPVGVGAGYGFL